MSSSVVEEVGYSIKEGNLRVRKVREELLITLHLSIGLLTQNYSLKESWIWLEMLFSCEVFELLLLHGII